MLSLQTQTFTYKTDASAGPIPATVHYAPPSPDDAAPRPIALIFHAGGFVVGSSGMIPVPQIATLARLGFVVVTPEYRLSPQVSAYEGAIADAKACLVWAQDTLPAALQAATGVSVDGTKVVAMGHSAGGTLALHLGGTEVTHPRPLAILDFYGPKLFTHDFWRQPLPLFAQIPPQPAEFLEEIFEGPVPVRAPPMFVNGKPDLASPRSAWMIGTLRDGTNIASVAAGLKKVATAEDIERTDPLSYLHHDFPPTLFVHGTADVFAPQEVSTVAYSRLRELGVWADVVSVEGAAHVFDIALKDGDELFDGPVIKGLTWLAWKAGLRSEW